MSQPLYGMPQRNDGNNQRLIVIALICLIGFIQYRNGDFPFDQLPDRNQDNQVTPEPVNPDQDSPEGDQLKPGPVNVQGCWLVVVEETEGRPVKRQLVLDHTAFWHSLKSKGMGDGGDDPGFDRHDPDTDAAKDYIAAAARRNVSPPFVMLVDEVGNCKKVIPFPETVAEIEAMLR